MMEPKNVIALTPGSVFLMVSPHSAIFPALAGWLYRACGEPFQKKKEGASPPVSWPGDLDAVSFGWHPGEEAGEDGHRREMLGVAQVLYGYAQALTTVRDKIPSEIVEMGLAWLLSATLSAFQLWVDAHATEFSADELASFPSQRWDDLNDKLTNTLP